MRKSIFEKIRHNHFFAMIFCCAIPLIAISALSFFGILGSWGFYALMLLCPLAHLWMMRGMSRTPENVKLEQTIKEIEQK